jgi:hypothetical protein
MLLAVSESTSLIMHVHFIQTAITMIDLLKINLPKVFQGIGRNELNVVKMKILNVLQSTGPILEKKLFAMVFSELPNSGRDFPNLIADMEKMEDIIRGRRQSQPDIIYVGLNNLEHRKQMGMLPKEEK